MKYYEGKKHCKMQHPPPPLAWRKKKLRKSFLLQNKDFVCQGVADHSVFSDPACSGQLN